MSVRTICLILLSVLAASAGCRSAAPAAPPATPGNLSDPGSARCACSRCRSGSRGDPGGAEPTTGWVAYCGCRPRPSTVLWRSRPSPAPGRSSTGLWRIDSWTAALEQQGEVADLPPAVIADLDETLLDNSPYEADRIRVGGRFEPVSWNAWVTRARAAAIPGAAEFVHYAAARGVTVFYVTNRAAVLEEATRVNLAALGFPLAGDRDTLLMPGERPDWGSDKSPRRAEVARSFRILLLVGDDLGDFVSGARARPEERVALAESHTERWQRQWILLPNPYYGSWERALVDHERDLSEAEILRRKLGRLHGSE